MRRAALLAGLALLVGVAALVFVALRPGARRPTRGTRSRPPEQVAGVRVQRFALRSRLLVRSVSEVAVIPPGAARGRALLVLLHGRGVQPDSFLRYGLAPALRRLGARAPDVVLADGGDHSYFHDRRDGAWGSYVMREVIPAAAARLGADPDRVAVGGISMGGFGALDLARLHPGRFCAVGGHSPAVARSAAEAAPGAFDGAADFAAHDLLGAARSQPRLYGRTPVWIDVGSRDFFRAVDGVLAGALRAGGSSVRFTVWPGDHEGGYWSAHMARYLAFYAGALAGCRR